MAQAAELRVCVERDWGRDRQGHLRGAYGRMIRREIEARFNSGPPSYRYVDEEPQPIPGRYDRWDQLEALSDLGFDPLAQVVDGQHIIYDQPIQVRGELAASPVWRWLRQTAGLDRALSLHHRTELALGSAVIRPVFQPWRSGIYHPAGLRVTPPDQCIAVADPTSPGRLITYAEIIPAAPGTREHWLVWDVSDPGAPYLGRWESVDAWASGRSPTWLMEGVHYPLWMGGRPIIGAVAGQAVPETDEPMPFFRGRAQGLKDLVMQRLWVDYVRHVSSINRALILSEIEVKGLSALVMDPTNVGNVWAQAGVQPVLQMIEHGLDGVQILWEMLRDRAEEWAQGVDPRFEVRRSSDAAKSGTALLIELTGQVQAANEAETRREPIDIAIIEMLCAAHNYLVRSGQIRLMSGRGGIDWAPYRGTSGPEWLIPEVEDLAIGYTRRWNEVERQRARADLFAAAEVGLEDWRAVWLFDRGLEDDRPDGENWTAAGVAIEGALAGKARFAALGMGVAAEKLWLGVDGASGNKTIERQAPAEEGGAMGLNGAQMQMALEIVDRVLTGKAPREVGIGQLVSFLSLAPEQAEQVMGEIGRSFVPVQPEGYDAALRETAGADVQAVQTALAMQSLGYGAEQIAAFLRERGVVGGELAEVPETPLAEVFTPSAEAQRTASRGLRLRDEHGRGLDGMTPQGKRLLARAKKLRNGDDFTRGEVLDLDVWLEAHQGDGEKDQGEGAWGDDSDPSAMWIEWLSQGGEDGLAWTNGILTEPEGGPEEAGNDGMETDSSGRGMGAD